MRDGETRATDAQRIRYVSMLLECIIALNETKTENNILVLLHSIFRLPSLLSLL